ncbi:MAG: dihydrofolate reductase [Polyangiaceae bacterium]
MPPSAPLILVLAIARNGVIGKDGKVPWHIPEDLRHFKAMTVGHAILMGRKTYEENRKPLPNRRNIVITRNPDYHAPGCEVVPSLEAAIHLARTTDPEPRVIGGAEIYALALPLATRIYLTEIDMDAEGDTTFHLDRTGFQETDRRKAETPGVWFVTLDRTDP